MYVISSEKLEYYYDYKFFKDNHNVIEFFVLNLGFYDKEKNNAFIVGGKVPNLDRKGFLFFGLDDDEYVESNLLITAEEWHSKLSDFNAEYSKLFE